MNKKNGQDSAAAGGSSHKEKKYPWTARRIAALTGIILLLAMYGSTMVFALSGSPNTRNLLMASIFCTIAVPILLYAMAVTARNLHGRGTDREIRDAYEKIKQERGDDAGSGSDIQERSDDDNSDKDII